MKQIMKAITLCSVVATYGLAYSVNGDLKLEYTGYKMEKKIGVKGTFKEVKLNSAQDADFAKFAKSLSVEIDGGSVDTKLKMRDNNVATIFLKSANPKITAKIVDVKGDATKGTFVLAITMGAQTKNIDFPYTVNDTQMEAKGSLDIMDFGMKESFEMYAKKCASFHQKKSWSTVDMMFVLPIKK